MVKVFYYNFSGIQKYIEKYTRIEIKEHHMEVNEPINADP